MADERMHPACRWPRLRALQRGEAGFALIEVVVSAALVMVIAAAVLGGVDVPSVISGENQAGSQAAALAQQDQERMRAMPIAQLINHTKTTEKTVDGRDYTVQSRVTWVTDSGSTVACSSGDTTSGDYLRLSSTVDAPGQRRPVEIHSLLAPPNGSLATTKGNLAVLVTDQAGHPLPGASVQVTGQTGKVTDSNGCAFYALINPGQYQVTVSKSGYVDKGGNASIVQTATVSIGNTSLVQASLGLATTLITNFETNNFGTIASSRAQKVTLANSGLPGTGRKVVTTASTSATSITATGLYPFTDGYTAFSGDCASSDPIPGYGPFSAIPPPGGSATVTVRQPAMLFNLKINGQTPVGVTGGKAFVKSAAGSGCNYKFTNLDLTSNGRLVDPGFPEGTYDMCIEGAVPQYGSAYITRLNIPVTNYAGETQWNLEAMTSNPQGGTCPSVWR